MTVSFYDVFYINVYVKMLHLDPVVFDRCLYATTNNNKGLSDPRLI